MKIFLIRSFFGALFAISCSSFTFASEAKKNIKQDKGFGFGAVPALTFGPDSGFGYGVAGTLYKKSEEIKPYRYAFDLLLYMTTKKIHAHLLSLDALRVFDLPLRIKAKLGFFTTINANFCGKGSLANCDESIATAAASQINFPSKAAKDDFIWRYFHQRYFDMYGLLYAKWQFGELPKKLEGILSWRGNYYLAGDWNTRTPYPNNLYAKTFEIKDEYGFLSLLEAGVSYDSRDNEPAPTSGYWLEATVRGGAPVWGSKWLFGALNLTARGYWPLIRSHKLVFADQLMFDGMIGDAPLAEIVRVGGTLGSLNATAFGGQTIGRGLREQYFPGRVKFINQAELRYTFWGFDLFSQHFVLGTVGFLDAGIIAWDFKQLRDKPIVLADGCGGGLRITWNKTFVIRADIAFSKFEDYSPQFYITVRNVF